eukprot:CAMPEP_0184692728 /NCGR_PEP_ID=MMETSP0313-20130426/1082_1 /TAXON_ID=2792 /ORGANISM="Porphyridium aerugineum, Strain SAG 1380-2" /LENGTH=518 /DNA_ID=CAMNT_0027150577 /DNA_START=137 /DNA_END=1690 /DNA_ORIENTATION=-
MSTIEQDRLGQLPNGQHDDHETNSQDAEDENDDDVTDETVDESDSESDSDSPYAGMVPLTSDPSIPSQKVVAEKKKSKKKKRRAMSDKHKISWVMAAFLIIGETVSLGVLAMASNFSTFGYVPTIALIVGLGLVATYTGYVILDFYMLNKEHVMTNYGEAATLVLGQKFGTFVHIEQSILLFLSMGATAKSAGQAIYSLTQHKFCLAVLTAGAAMLGVIMSYPIYMRGVSVLSALAFGCICASMSLNIVGMFLQGTPMYNLPAGTNPEVSAFPPHHTTFRDGLASITTIVFGYVGHIVFFEFIHSMKKPKEFKKALVAAQTFAISAYTVVGYLVYHVAGIYAQSPALLNLSPDSLFGILGWLFLLPNLLVGDAIDANVLCHNIIRSVGEITWWNRFLGKLNAQHPSQTHIEDEPPALAPAMNGNANGIHDVESNRNAAPLEETAVIHENTPVTIGFRIYWVFMVFSVWMGAFLVAEVIPTFNGLLTFSSIFSTQFTYLFPALFWLISVHKAGKLAERW